MKDTVLYSEVYSNSNPLFLIMSKLMVQYLHSWAIHFITFARCVRYLTRDYTKEFFRMYDFTVNNTERL